MQPKRSFILTTIVLLFVFIFSLFSPVTSAFADDGTPPAPTEEPALPPTEEPVAGTEAAPTGEPVAETEAAPTGEPVAETEAAPTAEPEAETPSDVLESAPDGVDVVVLDENGDPMALTTEEAAQVIVNGDPKWCPNGVTPGTDTLNECTPSYASFAELIADLTDGGYAGDGTIYVAYNYSDAEGNITFDHSSGSLSDLGDLIIQGGWDFGADGMYNGDATYQSNLGDNALSIINWTGNVTVNNIFISGASPDSGSLGGLYVQTAGDVAMNYVTVNDTQYTDTTGENGTGIYIANDGDVDINEVKANENDNHGLYVTTGGNVSISNASFSENGYIGYSDGSTLHEYGDGLQVWGRGGITLANVFAMYSAGNGAFIFVDGSANIFDSIFEDNGQLANWYYTNSPGPFSNYDEYYATETWGGDGLYLTGESVVIDNSGFYNNGGSGAQIFADGDLTITGSSFSNNGYWGRLEIFTGYDYEGLYYDEFQMNYEAGSGLYAEAEGDITLSDIWAIWNANTGIDLYSEIGDISISYSEVAENGWGGTFFEETNPGESYLGDYLDLGFCSYISANGIDYQALIFDPCNDSGYIDLQGAKFYYHVALQDPDGTDPLHINYYNIMQSGGAGLDVESEGGSITLNEMGVYSNAGDGADLNADQNVLVMNSDFEENGAAGYLGVGEELDVFSASSGFGGGLGFTYGSGLIADGENVTLIDVASSYNYHHGADLESGNTILVENSEFVANGEFIYIGGEGGLFGEFLYSEIGLTSLPVPSSSLGFDISFYSDAFSDLMELYLETSAGSGLYTDSNGDTTLKNVLAAANLGYGADLWSNTNMNISDSGFYSNGDGIDLTIHAYGNIDSSEIHMHMSNGSGLYAGADNDVTLSNVEASGNTLNGAELESYAANSVTVSNSSFNGNGFGGIHSHYYLYDDGVTYTEEIEDLYGSGLYVETEGKIFLDYVTANGNYLNGAELYTSNGPILVLCGQYNGNGEYGIYAAGGPSLGLYGPEILNNGMAPDEYFFDGGSITVSEDCVLPIPPEDPKKPGTGGGTPGLPINVIPVAGGFDCTAYSGTLLTLPNGDKALYPCPIMDEGKLEAVELDALPGDLPEGNTFVSSFTTFLSTNGKAQAESGKFITVSFLIPEGTDQDTLTILYWNGEKWVDLGGQVSEDGLYFEVSTKLLGTFVLTSK